MNDQRIIYGDCREVINAHLRHIDVSVIVMDPPYGLSYVSGYLDPSKSRASIDGDAGTHVRDFVLGWAAGRIPVACFAPWRLPAPLGARGRVVWDKGPCSGMGDLDFPWRSSTEDIYLLGPGWHGDRRPGLLSHHVTHAGSCGRMHPHEKPVGLLVEILRTAPPGLVLDPCCGSGSTLLAARMLGRPAIGIEIDQRWIDVAWERLKQGVLFTC